MSKQKCLATGTHIVINKIRYLPCWQYHELEWDRKYGRISPDCDWAGTVKGKGYEEYVICPHCHPEYARNAAAKQLEAAK